MVHCSRLLCGLRMITSRIESWTSRDLSFAGWLQFFTAFRLNWSSFPKNFIKAMERKRSFRGLKYLGMLYASQKIRWIRFERGARMELRNHNETSNLFAEAVRQAQFSLVSNVLAFPNVLLTACQNLTSSQPNNALNLQSLLNSVSRRFDIEEMGRQLCENRFDIEACCVTMMPSRKKGESLVFPNLKLKVLIEAIRIVLEILYDERFVTFSYGGRVLKMYVVKYLDEILVITSGSKMLTMDFKNWVLKYLEGRLDLRVDKMKTAIHSAVSENISFLGMELQAVPPSVLHPPKMEKAIKARKKYLRQKEVRALEFKNARERNRKILGMKILQHVFKKLKQSDGFKFDFQIENEV
ncbi:hypothetical protein SO802_013353 [Lithocarpus litseifolius]|uniref:Reverse transcriptase domain-containing protein n=1 Tax=Lithocarpus litseifolius TaxID=425828 RepID=A0AAW2D7K3_9ROSI